LRKRPIQVSRLHKCTLICLSLFVSDFFAKENRKFGRAARAHSVRLAVIMMGVDSEVGRLSVEMQCALSYALLLCLVVLYHYVLLCDVLLQQVSCCAMPCCNKCLELYCYVLLQQLIIASSLSCALLRCLVATSTAMPCCNKHCYALLQQALPCLVATSHMASRISTGTVSALSAKISTLRFDSV